MQTIRLLKICLILFSIPFLVEAQNFHHIRKDKNYELGEIKLRIVNLSEEPVYYAFFYPSLEEVRKLSNYSQTGVITKSNPLEKSLNIPQGTKVHSRILLYVVGVPDTIRYLFRAPNDVDLMSHFAEFQMKTNYNLYAGLTVKEGDVNPANAINYFKNTLCVDNLFSNIEGSGKFTLFGNAYREYPETSVQIIGDKIINIELTCYIAKKPTRIENLQKVGILDKFMGFISG